MVGPWAELEIPAGNLQRAPLDESPCQSAPRPHVDGLHRRAGHAHLLGTFLLRHAQVIHESDALIVLDLHLHGGLCFIRLRREAHIPRHDTDTPRLGQSSHILHLDLYS